MAERHDAQTEVLDPILDLWWAEGIRVPDYFDDPAIRESDFLLANPTLREEPPEHTWRWDPIGIDHTDPAKVAQALQIAHDKGFITDRDIQETRYNRDVEDWKEDIRDQMDFRKEVGLEPDPAEALPPGAPGGSQEGSEAEED